MTQVTWLNKVIFMSDTVLITHEFDTSDLMHLEALGREQPVEATLNIVEY